MFSHAPQTRPPTLQLASIAGPSQDSQVLLFEPVLLSKGRVHELAGDSAFMFAALAASHMKGPIIWAGPPQAVRTLAPTGLQSFFDPARLILTTGVSRTEILWAAEQSLRARCAPCVIVEIHGGPDLQESRRLQIAAEEHGALGLIIVHGRSQTSASETRWHCQVAPGGGWDWACIKNKRGRVGRWHVTWAGNDDAPCAIPLVSAASA